MLCRRMVLLFVVMAASMLGAAGLAQAQFQPWSQEHLMNDSWIAKSAPTDPTDPAQMLQIHTVNGGSYPVGFDPSTNTAGAVKGMNSLMFTDGTSNSGRLAGDPAGGFAVTCGGTKAYTDLLVMVAIDADELPAGFAFSLGRQGQAPRTFDVANDFAFVDASADDAGRPSGYFSESDPSGSPLGYDFNRGFVTIMAFADDPLSPQEVQWFDYEFEDLPGKAVFSLYGKVASSSWIYHTNRDVPDQAALSEALHTFEVAPEPTTAIVLLAGAAGLLRRRRSL